MSNYHSLTDQEVFVLMQGGDQYAFKEIYLRFHGLLYLYARKMLPDQDEAQDIVQDVFISLWNKAETRIDGQLSSYLYTAVRYKIFDWFDKNKSRTNYLQSLGNFMEQGVELTDHYIRERELAALIEKEVSLLPSKMRMIFEMSRQQYLSQREIAEILHLSDKTVKKQMSNALKILRLKLTSLLLLLIFFMAQSFS